MTSENLSAKDHHFLRLAIELSRHALEDEGKTPFGAIVVIQDEVVSEGTSSVVELRDPTAHAEIQALRAAGQRQGTHLLDTAVMYCSSEPCPMCLIACYWARVPRLVFGATSHDVARLGFEDLQFYNQLKLDSDQRFLREDAAGEDLRAQASAVLEGWAALLPEPVVPKF